MLQDNLINEENSFLILCEIAVQLYKNQNVAKEDMQRILESFCNAVGDTVDEKTFQKNKKAFAKYLRKVYFHLTHTYGACGEYHLLDYNSNDSPSFTFYTCIIKFEGCVSFELAKCLQ